MKHLLITSLIGVLISSCSFSDNFSKRKYLNLDGSESKNENYSQNLSNKTIIEDTKDTDAPECDTIRLINGEIILAEIIEEKKNSVWYYKCSAVRCMTH